ncbi:helix-turn-helix domain-containing protein [Streptomyces varsoviensis]|uniref:helix-turn-helix domain-containing protein n=1 Tax=Streptomyces varsoviensis TaxID=67373 RepID=UPI000563E0A9|nr:helix-turn-helix domain-containing protein [Streptomyces varsoviensis]
MSEPYRERPSAAVRGAVVWTRTATGEPGRVLPDGCVDLLWMGGRLLVAGPDTRAHLPSQAPGDRCSGLRFAPGTGPPLLGVPAHELRDRRVPLDALWPGPVVRRLTEHLAAAPLPGRALERIALERLAAGQLASDRLAADRLAPDRLAADHLAADRLAADQLASDRLAPGRTRQPGPGAYGPGPSPLPYGPGPRPLPYDPVIARTVEAMRAGLPVATLAADVGLGERQLHRRCLNAFGYGPKTLARVLRMNRALESARAGRPYAEVAAEAGYADQAHLAREVKSLAGVPLGVLLRGAPAAGDQPAGSGAKRSTPLPSGSWTMA